MSLACAHLIQVYRLTSLSAQLAEVVEVAEVVETAAEPAGIAAPAGSWIVSF